MSIATGKRLIKYADTAVCSAAGMVFNTVQFFNKHFPNPSFTPKWSDKASAESHGRSRNPPWDSPEPSELPVPRLCDGGQGKDHQMESRTGARW